MNHSTAHPHVDLDGTIYNMGNSIGSSGPMYNVVEFPTGKISFFMICMQSDLNNANQTILLQERQHLKAPRLLRLFLPDGKCPILIITVLE